MLKRRRMSLVSAFTVALACSLLLGCEPSLEATYVTPAGLHVYSEADALPFEPEELDAVMAETLAAFAQDWNLPTDPRAVPLPVLSVLGQDTYRLADQQVAGNLSFDGKWIYIGAKTRPLHDTAFVHELIHYFDLVANGSTDESHASWRGRINDTVLEINRRIASGKLRQPLRGS